MKGKQQKTITVFRGPSTSVVIDGATVRPGDYVDIRKQLIDAGYQLVESGGAKMGIQEIWELKCKVGDE